MIGWINWNPPREAFRVPFLDHPIVWYGVIFTLGFLFGYFLVFHTLKRNLTLQKDPDPKSNALYLTDRLTWFIVLGTVIGARLGHVLFYNWQYFKHPVEILKVWHGGLASHGGVIGILIALYLYYRLVRKKFPTLTYLKLTDIIVVPAALAAAFIRVGNFFNQELIGTQTSVPWAVVFGSPADGSYPVPRHPVQLYEAIAYFTTFIILYMLWNRFGEKLKAGTLTGLFFVMIFSSRFVIEFWKAYVPGLIETSWLQTSQLLHIPLIIAGIALITYSNRRTSV